MRAHEALGGLGKRFFTFARFSRQWLHQAFFKFFCLCRHHSEPSKPKF